MYINRPVEFEPGGIFPTSIIVGLDALGGIGDIAAFLFGGLALPYHGSAPRDLVGGQVFYVGGDGPLVVVGVGDSG